MEGGWVNEGRANGERDRWMDELGKGGMRGGIEGGRKD